MRDKPASRIPNLSDGARVTQEVKKQGAVRAEGRGEIIGEIAWSNVALGPRVAMLGIRGTCCGTSMWRVVVTVYTALCGPAFEVESEPTASGRVSVNKIWLIADWRDRVAPQPFVLRYRRANSPGTDVRASIPQHERRPQNTLIREDPKISGDEPKTQLHHHSRRSGDVLSLMEPHA